MIKQLMSSRRFAPLFWAQFCSALNDNVLKNALVIILLYSAVAGHGDALVTVAGAVFIFPFFILSGLGGELADKYVKSVVARRLKFAEIFAAAFAAGGFFLHSVPLLFVALGLFGVVAALFGPVKYAMLPDQLAVGELATGNALVEGATFMAILIGTIAGGLFVSGSSHMGWVSSAVIVLALLSWAFASRIPATTPSAADLPITSNPWTSTVGLLKSLYREPRLWDGMIIVSWFWLVGAVVLSLLPALVKDIVGGSEGVVTLCLAVFAIGIAVGSLFAAQLSHVRPNLALVPIGAIIMGIVGLDLALAISQTVRGTDVSPMAFATSFAGLRMLADFAVFAFGGGLFVVPSFAAVQAWSAPSERARVIAAGNVLQAAFMVVGSIFVALLQARGLPLGWIFFGLAVASFGAVWFVFGKWGKEGVRDFGALLFRALFRTEIRGLENLPPAGTRMLIAPNHVSLIDGPLLHAILPIEASFAVDTGIAKAWWAKPFLKMIRHYTMDPTKPLAARDLIKLVAAGEPVVIFPEGRITVSGSLMKVYDGTAMIADKADAVIVPVRIEGAQRSHLSYLKNGEIKRAWFPKVTISILPPVKLPIDQTLKGKLRRNAAGAALQDVMIDAMVKNAMLDQTLFEGLVHACRDRDTGKPIIEDALGTKLTYRKLILGAQVLGRKLERGTIVGENVGVLLPNSAGVAVVFMALQTIGRVPAMLNFSAGPANVLAAMKAAQVKTVLTSKAFIEKGKLDKLDCRDRAGGPDRLSGRCPRLDRHDRQGPRPDRGHHAARGPQSQRSRGGAVHVGFGRHAERRGAFPPQYSRQRGPGAGAGRRQRQRQGVQRASGVPFLWADGWHDDAAARGHSDLHVSLAAALPDRAGADLPDRRHHPVRHRHLPHRLCALGPCLRLPDLAPGAGRRRSGEGPHPADLYGTLWHPPARRLWRHRDRARAGHEHADGQPPGHRRTPLAADGIPPRSGPRHRGGRTALGARSERHARLSARREPRRAGAARRRLARHRRHRDHRRRRLHHDQGTRQALRQDCRRNGLLVGGRSHGCQIVAAGDVGCGFDSRPAQGRAHRAPDHQKDADRPAMQLLAKASGASELAVPAVIQVVDKLPLLGSGKTDYVAATALAKENVKENVKETAKENAGP